MRVLFLDKGLFSDVGSAAFFFNVECFIMLSFLLIFLFCMGKNFYSVPDYICLANKSFIDFIVNDVGEIVYIILGLAVVILYMNFDKRYFYCVFSQYSDDFIVVVKAIVIIFSCLTILISYEYFKHEKIFQLLEYYIIIIFCVFGILVLLSSNNFLSLYLSIELQSLGFYILASFKQHSLFSLEAGLKYFLLGTVSSGFLIFGSSLIYGVIGTLNFLEINFFLQQFFIIDSLTLMIGFLFFLSAILFKLGAAPFHVWVPDVYEGAPTIITLFFSIIPKLGFLSILIRLGSDFFYLFNPFFQGILTYCIVCSFFIGSFVSLYQRKIKRLLAYSAIMNIGYLLLGILAKYNEALLSSIVYFLIYNLIIISIFINFLLLRNFQNLIKIKNIFDFFGIFNSNLFLSFILIVNLFSLIGLPPLAGFFAKFYVFFNVLGSDLFFILYISILASLISAGIYLKMIRLLLFNKQNVIVFFHPFEKVFLVWLNFFFLFNIIIFFNSSLIFKIFYNCFLTIIY